jgi:Na+-transporting methylmalonyl-CoA/oxaloacetate decarboxylase gamma subunit
MGVVILFWIATSLYLIRRYTNMDNWTFGITMIVVGMGGTLLTLWILSLCMSVLKKFFPYKKEEEGK